MVKQAIQAVALAMVCALLPLGRAHADTRSDALQRAKDAITVLAQIQQAPDRAIPRDLLRNAKAIVVVPNVVKAGLILGGRHGRGLVSVRSADGTWSNPVFISLTGGSIGFQAGVSATDVVLVFRTEKGVDSLVDGKFTLGVDAAAAAGPVGRNAHASTDAQFKAEVYSYSRSRGLFAGVSLDGSALRIDYDADTAIYGRGITPRRIFEGGVSNVPGPVVDFRDRLEEYTAQ
jgi:lipid-binding SYLF domain-containing protein